MKIPMFSGIQRHNYCSDFKSNLFVVTYYKVTLFSAYFSFRVEKYKRKLKLEAQGPCAGHRSTIAILHCFSLVHEKYTN